LKPAEHTSGVELPWPHRLQAYVPDAMALHCIQLLLGSSLRHSTFAFAFVMSSEVETSLEFERARDFSTSLRFGRNDK